MNLSNEKKKEIEEFINTKFVEFIKKKKLHKNRGFIDPIQFIENNEAAAEFLEFCKMPIPHSSEEELEEMNKYHEERSNTKALEIIHNYLASH